MAFSLTADQIITLAPDDNSAKSGRDLAHAKNWVKLGTTELIAWGECKGSGSNPYQTCVDLTEIAFKCSCPSRKFPCKHGLALLLLLSKDSSLFNQPDAPSWADSWLKGRAERTEKKAKKAEEPPKPVDREAQTKRATKREQNVESGIAELDRWLQDAARHGLADLQTRPYHFWEGQAARLVDARAPGLARMLRDCAGIPSSGGDWQERLLSRLSRIYLLLEAYKRISELPVDLAAELRNLIGYTVPQDEVMQSTAVNDRWYIAAQSVEEDEKLKSQRTWLLGEKTGRTALILSFAYGSAYFDTSLVAGTVIDADLVFYPGAPQIRALVKCRRGQAEPFSSFPSKNGIADIFEEWARTLAINPWLELYPVALTNVRTVPVADGKWELQDESGHAVRLHAPRDTAWVMMAQSGGEPINLFGEWNGRSVRPLAIYAGSKYMRCNTAVTR